MDSWEPIKHFRNAKELIRDFESKRVLQPEHKRARLDNDILKLKAQNPDCVTSVEELNSSDDEETTETNEDV